MVEISQLEKASQEQNMRRLESEEKRKLAEANPKKASLQEKIKEFEAEIASMEQPLLTAAQVQRFIDTATATLQAVKSEVSAFHTEVAEFKQVLKQLSTTDQSEQQLIANLTAYLERY
jgi:translation initiation factor 2B subunit (eIF-2B alpha/beta/delta family)